MARILRSPSKYVQGAGELGNLKEYLSSYGRKALFIISKGGYKRSSQRIIEGLVGANVEYTFAFFAGKVTSEEIRRLCENAQSENVDMVVGIGGGKIIDTAKAVGYYNEIPIIIAPTVASTDAPCSALSILYFENGIFDKYLYLKESPNLVLVDTDLILDADTRLLVSGMGDALSTYYEARAVQRSGKNNQVNGKPTVAAFALAEKAKDILFRDGFNAKLAADNKVSTEAFQNIVEVNTYLSGVGFESGGLGAAHAIQKGLTHCHELDHVYHGEKVAFCLIAQLVLENASPEELTEVIKFLQAVGLPTTFKELGIPAVTDEMLMLISENSVRTGMTSHNMPFEMTEEKVFGALKAADAMGRIYR